MDHVSGWDDVTLILLYKGCYALSFPDTVVVGSVSREQGCWCLALLVKAGLQKVDYSCLSQRVILVQLQSDISIDIYR